MCGICLIQVFSTPRITNMSVIPLPENLEAADSLISERSAPESEKMETIHPDDLISPLMLPVRTSRHAARY